MNFRQTEEFAKLFLDIGKLVFASLVLGFFQSGLPPLIVLGYSLIGLILSIAFFIMGLRLFKEVK